MLRSKDPTPDANGRELAEFLADHVHTLEDDFGGETTGTRELLTLDDPWSD